MGFSMAAQAAQFVDGKWVSVHVPASRFLEPVSKVAEQIEYLLLLFNCVNGSMVPDCESDDAILLWLSLQEKSELLKAATAPTAIGNLSPAQNVAISSLHECALEFLDGFKKFISEHAVGRFRRSLQVIRVSPPTTPIVFDPKTGTTAGSPGYSTATKKNKGGRPSKWADLDPILEANPDISNANAAKTYNQRFANKAGRRAITTDNVANYRKNQNRQKKRGVKPPQQNGPPC